MAEELLRFRTRTARDLKRMSNGARIVITTNGELNVHIHGPSGARSVLCYMKGVNTFRFGSRSLALMAAELMIAAGEFEYTRRDEGGNGYVYFEIAARKEARANRIWRPRGPAVMSTMDPLACLALQVEFLDISTGLANLLKTGTPTRKGLGAIYLWQAVLHTRAELLLVLKPMYYREFMRLLAKLGLQPGEPLPEGDYPWNKPR